MKKNFSSFFVIVLIILNATVAVQAIHLLNTDNVESTNTSIYDLLIVSPASFSQAAMPLITHKNKVGVNTILVTTEDVYNQMYWQGRDDAEKLKLFIKKAIEEWGIQYVLLLGGRQNQRAAETWWIPVRYSHLDRNYDEHGERKFLSDLYFADIYHSNGSFSSWDDNANGIFGEWNQQSTADDRPDLTPDVALGRLPCRNIFEVRIVVNKIIQYETGLCSDSWFKKMVVVAGDTYPDKTEYYDGEVYTQTGLQMMSDFDAIKLWTSDNSLRNWVDVVREFNKGCGFIWFSGHGNPASWSTHPPDDNETWINGLRLRYMPFIHNRHKLPVCITGSGCFNSMFNVSLGNSPWVFGIPVPHCFSWGLAKKINGGSIATIGATAFSYESPDINLGYGGIEWLDIHFFEFYGIHQVDILGDIWKNTVTSFFQHHPINWDDESDTGSALIAKNGQQWLLIGDPSLKIGGYSL